MNEPIPAFSAFISYASPDREKAEQICHHLEAKGLKCWIAPRDVRAGREYGDEIIRGIEQSRCLVVVLSEAANQSTFVRREVERAVSKRKPVFPVRIEDVMPSPALELFVSSTHWIDAWAGPFTAHIDQLARELTNPSSEGPRTAALKPVPKRSIHLGVIAAAIVILIVGVLWTIQHFHSPPKPGGPTAKAEAPPRQEPTPSTKPIESPQIGNTDWFGQILATEGVKLEVVKQGDFQVELDTTRARRDALGLKLKVSPELAKVFTHGTLFLALDNSEFSNLGLLLSDTISSHKLDQPSLKRAHSVTIKFQFPNHVTVGPFTYALQAGEDLVRAQYKKTALKEKQWFRCYEHDGGFFASFQSLQKFFPAVRRVSFGESPEKLDRVIEVEQPVPLPDEEKIRELGKNYWFDAIPFRAGAETLYTQLEFYDGSKSDLKPAVMQISRSLAQGVELRTINGNKGEPLLFAAYDPDWSDLVFYPEVSLAVEKVLYSFDEGGFYEAERIDIPQGTGNEHELNAFTFRGPITNQPVRLQFVLKDGKTQEPFLYQLDTANLLRIRSLKTAFMKNIREAIECKRLKFDWPFPPEPKPAPGATLGDIQQQHNNYISKLDAAYSFFQIRGLTFVTNAPIIACVPHMGRESKYWVAVKEVQIGSAPGKTDRLCPVVLPANGDLPSGTHISRIWNATLPVDAPGVYARFVFGDGSQSDELRFPIVDVNNPR